MKLLDTRIDHEQHSILLEAEFVAGPRIRPVDSLSGTEVSAFTLLKPLDAHSLLERPEFPLGPGVLDFHQRGAKPSHALSYVAGATYWIGSEGYQWRRIEVPSGLSVFEPRLQRSGALKLSILGDLDSDSTKAVRVIDSAGTVHAIVRSSPSREMVFTGLAPGKALVRFGRLSEYVRDRVRAARTWRNVAEIRSIEVDISVDTATDAVIQCPPSIQSYGIVDGSFLLPAEHLSLLSHKLSVEFEYLGQGRGDRSRSLFEKPFVERTDERCHFRVPGLLEGRYRATLLPYGFEDEIVVSGHNQTTPAIDCKDPVLTIVYLEDFEGRQAGGAVWWRRLLTDSKNARRWQSTAIDGAFHVLTAQGPLELYGDFLSGGDQLEHGQAGEVLVLTSSSAGDQDLTIEFRLAGVPVGVPIESVVAMQATAQGKILQKGVIPQPTSRDMRGSDPLASSHKYRLTFEGGFPDQLSIHPMLDFEAPTSIAVPDSARESGILVVPLRRY
jgi:hypothetical protein